MSEGQSDMRRQQRASHDATRMSLRPKLLGCAMRNHKSTYKTGGGAVPRGTGPPVPTFFVAARPRCYRSVVVAAEEQQACNSIRRARKSSRFCTGPLRLDSTLPAGRSARIPHVALKRVSPPSLFVRSLVLLGVFSEVDRLRSSEDDPNIKFEPTRVLRVAIDGVRGSLGGATPSP